MTEEEPVVLNDPAIRDRALQFASSVQHDDIMQMLSDADKIMQYLLTGEL